MSKFFTRTKGDRSNASESLRSTKTSQGRIEYVYDRGFGYGGADSIPRATGKRPPPLTIQAPLSPAPKTGKKTYESLALQDAAVRSATTLITVMNEVLRSPLLSARLAAAQPDGHESSPVSQRSRACTAPSTPLCEAPSVKEPVELPASFPAFYAGSPPVPQVNPDTPDNGNPMKPDGLDYTERLPTASSHTRPAFSESIIIPQSGQQPPPFFSSPPQIHHSSYDEDDGRPVATNSVSPLRYKSKTSIPISPLDAKDVITPSTPIFTPISAITQKRELEAKSSFEAPKADAGSPSEARALDLRALHDAHIQSLKETHEKEIATQREYIRLLEQQSYASQQRSNSSESGQHTQAEAPAPSKTVEEAAEEEATAKKIESLETRLATAENERMMLLADYQAACEKVGALSQREQALDREVTNLRKAMVASRKPATPVSPLVGILEEQIHLQQGKPPGDLGAVADTAHPLLQQIRDLHQIVSEKDARIRELETESAQQAQQQKENAATTENLQAQVAELLEELEEQKRLLHEAKGDIEEYNGLLHAEIRQQIRVAADVQFTPDSDARTHARAVTVEQVAKVRAIAGLSTTNVSEADVPALAQAQSMISLLEKELHECIYELINYRLDVKSYKKDLKKANSKIKEFETGRVPTSKRNPSVAKSPLKVQPDPLPAKRKDSFTQDDPINSNFTGRSGLGVTILAPPHQAEQPKRSPVLQSVVPYTGSPLPPPLPPLPLRPRPTVKSSSGDPKIRPRVNKDLPAPPHPTPNSSPQQTLAAPTPVSSPRPTTPEILQTLTQTVRPDTRRSLSDSGILSSRGRKRSPAPDRARAGTLDSVPGTQTLPVIQPPPVPAAPPQL